MDGFPGRIKAALDDLDAVVFYMYPSSFASLPAVSYGETEASALLEADDEPLLFSVEYAVDIWARAFSGARALGALVAERLSGLGFAVEIGGDQYDKALGVCRRTLRCRAAVIKETEE